MQMLAPEVFELQVARRQEDNKAGGTACQAFHAIFIFHYSIRYSPQWCLHPVLSRLVQQLLSKGSAELPVSHSLIPFTISLSFPIWTAVVAAPLPLLPCTKQRWQKLPRSLTCL